MTQKTILIAGATSMIGQACAKKLDASDHHLVLLGRNKEKIQKLADQITCKSTVIELDFSTSSTLAEDLAKFIAVQGITAIDAFIHNVAIYPWKIIESLSLDEWQQTLDINLTSAFQLTQFCLPFFKQQKSGRIVYLSSIAGSQLGLPNMAAYGTTKAGLNGFMRTAALELAPYDVTVNSISPGKVYDPTTLTKEAQKQKLANVPLGQFVDPMQVAHMVAFLLSPESASITGQDFIIDGGQTILGG